MPLQLLDADERRDILDVDLPNVPDGDKDTAYTFRAITIEDHRAIVKRNTKDTVDRRSHQKVPQTDWSAVADDVLDFVLLDWKGVLFRSQPVPCVREHKLRLDPVRKQSLSDLAGMNVIQRAPEVREQSFREPA